MAKKQLFKGLAQNIAHHSESYLSYLHPHLGEACKIAGVETITLDLLDGPVLPNNMASSKELGLAIPAWRNKFKEMATKIGVDFSQLQKATVNFDYTTWKDLSSAEATAELTLVDGTTYTATGWRPQSPENPEEKIPGTDLLWPKHNPKKELP